VEGVGAARALLVREFEREDRGRGVARARPAVVLLGGPLGQAPLDLGIDQVAAVARRHLGRGVALGWHWPEFRRGFGCPLRAVRGTRFGWRAR